MLIEQFKPVWNKVLDGFGNKTPGKGRKGQRQSPWDMLHPGRAFVYKLGLGPGKFGVEEIFESLDRFYGGAIPAEPLGSGEEVDSDDGRGS